MKYLNIVFKAFIVILVLIDISINVLTYAESYLVNESLNHFISMCGVIEDPTGKQSPMAPNKSIPDFGNPENGKDGINL